MKIFVILISCLFMIEAAYAHHDIHDDVNFGHLIQFGGSITSLEWAEPHVLIRIVGNPDLRKSPQFLVELDSSAELISSGLNMDTFEVFNHISIIGYPSKSRSISGQRYIYGLYLALSPAYKVLLNENLLNLLPAAEGLKAVPADNGTRFEATHNH